MNQRFLPKLTVIPIGTTAALGIFVQSASAASFTTTLNLSSPCCSPKKGKGVIAH